MWNLTYPDKADFTAILRTKDWTEGKNPTYEYKYLNKDQAKETAFNCSKRLNLCLNSDASYFPSPINKSFNGETIAGQKPEIIEKTLEQEWIENLSL
jgi:hypothetical protein